MDPVIGGFGIFQDPSEVGMGVHRFSKSIGWGGGGQSVKSAQGTIKILLKSDFSSDLTH